ncbi:GDSL-type esterase/lipase family protein [Paenibacillus sediminis]|uniref:Lysophospholipase L1-like esterase n=1 Tax=Paenibacillus sediminis TaxID=664909 RepID=A0ABS4H003_9BACL|nr:GDSL-type esterase/lipase family protein [Paenibacillus sediminis]MBP1935849.1 lysophospholipase L1-like esterase [Paenibacillus sediminis]
MNSSKTIWITVSTISLVATLLLISGFIYAVKDIVAPAASENASEAKHEAKTQEPMGNKSEITVAAIGDSLAKGTGDDTGDGFVRRAVTLLQERDGVKVRLLNNLAINGLTTDRLLSKLDEKGVQYVLKRSDIILLSIGGNDLFRAEQTNHSRNMQDITLRIPSKEEILKVSDTASLRLQTILGRIHQINPGAKIIYVGLYNPFADLKQMREVGNEAVTDWNYRAAKMTSKDNNIMIIPTFDLFQENIKSYLSSDHFHPNGDGYEQIAERIIQGIQ